MNIVSLSLHGLNRHTKDYSPLLWYERKKETVQLSLGFFLFRSFSLSPIDKKKKKTSNVQALIRELSFFDQFYWSTTRRSLIFCSLMHVIFYSNVYTNEKSVWSKPTNIQLDHLYAVQMEISQTYRFPMDWFFFSPPREHVEVIYISLFDNL